MQGPPSTPAKARTEVTEQSQEVNLLLLSAELWPAFPLSFVALEGVQAGASLGRPRSLPPPCINPSLS